MLKAVLKLLMVFCSLVGALVLAMLCIDLVADKSQAQIFQGLKAFFDLIVPTLINFGIGVLVIALASRAFHPLQCAVDKCINATNPTISPRGKRFWTLGFQSIFWVAVVLIAGRIVAPTFMENAMVSGGIIIGALVLAAKDEMKGIIGSIELHTLPKCQEGDYVRIIGTEAVEGVITKIDYLHTHIDLKGEGKQKIVIPNAKLWDGSLVIGRAELKLKCQEGDYIKLVGTDAVEGVITKIDMTNAVTMIDLKGEGNQLIVVPNSKLTDAALIVGKAPKEEKKEKKDEKVVVVVRCCGSCDCADTACDAESCAEHGCTCANPKAAAGSDLGERSARADAESNVSTEAAADGTQDRGPRSAGADSKT